jgi:hypothetical protein
MGFFDAIGSMYKFSPDKGLVDPLKRFKPVQQQLGGFEQQLAQKQSFNPAEIRNQQMGLGQRFEDILSGKGPSVAEQQMRMGQEAALKAGAAQTGLAAARGGGYGGLARGLAGAQVQSSQDIANQSSLLRAQEQQAAMGQYGNLLQGMRGQDLQYQSDLDQRRAQLMGLGLTAAQAEQQAIQEVEKMNIEGAGKKRDFWGKLIQQGAQAAAMFV